MQDKKDNLPRDSENQNREDLVEEIFQYLKWQEPYVDPSKMADYRAFVRSFGLIPKLKTDSEMLDNRDKYDSEKFLELRNLSGADLPAFNALREISAMWVDESQDLPKEIKIFVSDYLRNKVSPPSKKKGKKVDSHKRIALAMSVYKVIKKGYPAGCNDTAVDNNENAFSIVQEAANKLGWSDVTYNTVRDYYYSFPESMRDQT